MSPSMRATGCTAGLARLASTSPRPLAIQLAIVRDVGLVAAVLAAQDALRARRNGEGLAVPLECRELAKVVAEPAARERGILDLHAMPPDLLHGIRRHLASQG